MSKKLLLIIILFIALFIFQDNLKNYFYYFSSPFQNTFWSLGQRISILFEEKDDIERLRRENTALYYQVGKYSIYKRENEALREILDLEINEEFDFFFSKIIGKKISDDIIILNKGRKDGAKEGMPVITPEKMLIGRVETLYDNFSEVLLISKEDFLFDVIINEESLAMGRGGGSFSLYLEMIPSDSLIEEGDIVITSGRGGLFPEGLVVGKIESLEKDDIDFYYTGQVEIFNISLLRELLIINF